MSKSSLSEASRITVTNFSTVRITSREFNMSTLYKFYIYIYTELYISSPEMLLSF